MNASRYVHLGFEVGGDPGHSSPVVIPIRHMAVTGQTQESGKTTALTALISRASLPAIAFLTKRGEGEMPGRKILPYFQDRADWRFVQSILESTMREKMKFERAWIVRACQSARTLRDVQRNLVKLEANARNALSKDVYMLLGEYLERVVPLLDTLPKTDKVDIDEGLAVMDLVKYPLELQMLVINSTLTWIHQHANGVISIIPEAWKFIPQGRNTPVRIAAENLMREGAAIKNYVWIDSQDMAGVDKILLRGCPVWLIGVQREPLEIKRALASMGSGLKKPKADDVAGLELGQFYACFGKSILKTYVQPAWMDEKAGKLIASGRLDVHDLSVTAKSPSEASDRLLGLTHTTTPKTPHVAPCNGGTGRVESPAGSAASGSHSSVCEDVPQSFAQEEEDVPINPQTIEALKLAIKDGAKDTALRLLDSIAGNGTAAADLGGVREYSLQESRDNEALYQAIKSRLLEEAPGIIVSLAKQAPEIEVREVREKISMDTTTPEGRVAFLIADGYFSVNRINADVVNELANRGMPTLAPNVKRAFDSLTEKGFLIAKDKGRYVAVEGMKVNILEAQ